MVLRFALFGFAALLSSCAVVPGKAKIPDEAPVSARVYFQQGRKVDLPPRLARLNPGWWLGNADTAYESWWKPCAGASVRRFTWAMRNPGHNFTHYVAGVADRDSKRTGTAPKGVWNPDGGWNFSMTHAGPFIHLPFASHKGKRFEGYLGWREDGNLGAAFRRAEHDPKEREKPVDPASGEKTGSGGCCCPPKGKCRCRGGKCCLP